MGIKITTDDRGPVKVWRSEKNGFVSYAIGVSKKEGDNWINGYQPVRFLKGIDVPNGAEITISHAFPILTSWVKDGKQYTRVVWQIMEFKGPRSSVQQDDGYADFPESFSQVTDEIPF